MKPLMRLSIASVENPIFTISRLAVRPFSRGRSIGRRTPFRHQLVVGQWQRGLQFQVSYRCPAWSRNGQQGAKRGNQTETFHEVSRRTTSSHGHVYSTSSRRDWHNYCLTYTIWSEHYNPLSAMPVRVQRRGLFTKDGVSCQRRHFRNHLSHTWILEDSRTSRGFIKSSFAPIT